MSTVTISRPFLITMVTISLVIFFTKAFFTLFIIFIGMTAIMTICTMSMTISAMSVTITAMSLTISAITMAISSMSVTSMTVPVTSISLVSCKAVGADQFSDDEVGINVVPHNRPRVVVVLTSIWRCVK